MQIWQHPAWLVCRKVSTYGQVRSTNKLAKVYWEPPFCLFTWLIELRPLYFSSTCVCEVGYFLQWSYYNLSPIRKTKRQGKQTWLCRWVWVFDCFCLECILTALMYTNNSSLEACAAFMPIRWDMDQRSDTFVRLIFSGINLSSFYTLLIEIILSWT